MPETPEDIQAELDALVAMMSSDPEAVLQAIWRVDEQTARTYLSLAVPSLAILRQRERYR